MNIEKPFKEKKGSVSLLFSGGADSTLSSCLLAKSFNKVHLLTYKRFGFFGEKIVLNHVKKVRQRFPEVVFSQNFIEYDNFYKDLAYKDYLKGIKQYGFIVLSTCGFCKLSMHWRNIIYCIDNNIKYAADGATFDSKEYIEQNPRMLMPEIKKMYKHFGITHLNPVYQEGFSTEKELYRLGIINKEKIKRTKYENQIFCSQHILYAMVLRTYLSKHNFSEYEDTMKRFFKEKINYIVKTTEGYVRGEKDNKISKLIN